MPGSPTFAAEAIKTCCGLVLALVLLMVLLGANHYVSTGSVFRHEVSDARCEELRYDPDGYNEKTGKNSDELWFGLSCDDRPGLDRQHR